MAETERPVLVIGGTGFVGSTGVRELLNAGMPVRCIVRFDRSRSRLAGLPVQFVPGDITDAQSIFKAAEGCRAAINYVGLKPGLFPAPVYQKLHVDGTRNIVRAAKEHGLERVVYISAIGVRENDPSPYFATKWAAEQAVIQSGIPYTIFRPSFISGPGAELFKMLSDLTMAPVIPVIGDGRYRVQPIASRDLGKAVASALQREAAVNKIYEAVGPRSYSFDELLDELLAAKGRRAHPKLHAPAQLVKPFASLGARMLGSRTPLSPGQISMLLQGSTGDPEPLRQDLGIQLTPLPESLREYL